jgi:hypothetical protein
MTAVCISSTRGVDPYVPNNYTLATSAPTSSFDFEVRYNLTDQNSVAINKLDLVKFIKATIAGIESGNIFFPLAVNGSDYVGPVL